MPKRKQSVNVEVFDTYEEAWQAAQRIRRASDVEGGMLVRVTASPYGGFTVMSLPAEVFADLVAEGIPLPKLGGIYNKKIPA